MIHCQKNRSKTQNKPRKNCSKTQNKSLNDSPFLTSEIQVLPGAACLSFLLILYRNILYVAAVGNYRQVFQTTCLTENPSHFLKLKSTLLLLQHRNLVVIFDSSLFLIIISKIHLIPFIPKVITPGPLPIISHPEEFLKVSHSPHSNPLSRPQSCLSKQNQFRDS